MCCPTVSFGATRKIAIREVQPGNGPAETSIIRSVEIKAWFKRNTVERSADHGRRTCDKIEAGSPGRAIFIEADVSDKAQVGAAVEKTVAHFGGLLRISSRPGCGTRIVVRVPVEPLGQAKAATAS